MGLAILLVKASCDDDLPRSILIVFMALSGLLVYMTAIRFCLTREDNELLGSICDIFPSRLGYILRLTLGVLRGATGKDFTP